MKIEDMKHGLPVRHQDGTRGTLAHNMTEWFLMHADGRRCINIGAHEVEPWEPRLGEWVTVGAPEAPRVGVRLIKVLSLSRHRDLILGLDVHGRVLRLELSAEAVFMPYHATIEPLNVYGSPSEVYAVHLLSDPTNCIPLSEARLRSLTDQRPGGIAGVRATAAYVDEARGCPVTEELTSQVKEVLKETTANLAAATTKEAAQAAAMRAAVRLHETLGYRGSILDVVHEGALTAIAQDRAAAQCVSELEKDRQTRRVPFGFGYGKGALSFQHALQTQRADVPSEERLRREQLELELERKYYAQLCAFPRDGHYPTPPQPDEREMPKVGIADFMDNAHKKIELPAGDVPQEPAVKANTVKANAVCYHCAGRAYETPFSQTCLETVCALPEPAQVVPSPWWGHNENKWMVTGIPTTIYHPDKDTAVALWKAAAMAYRKKMWRP